MPKPVYEEIRSRCYKNWDGMLDQLVEFTSIVFLQAEQRIIEQKHRELKAMYILMSGTCQVKMSEYNEELGQLNEVKVGNLVSG